MYLEMGQSLISSPSAKGSRRVAMNYVSRILSYWCLWSMRVINLLKTVVLSRSLDEEVRWVLTNPKSQKQRSYLSLTSLINGFTQSTCESPPFYIIIVHTMLNLLTKLTPNLSHSKPPKSTLPISYISCEIQQKISYKLQPFFTSLVLCSVTIAKVISGLSVLTSQNIIIFDSFKSMRSKRRLSRSSKQLIVHLPNRKLVLSKSSRDIHSPQIGGRVKIKQESQQTEAIECQSQRQVILQIENKLIRADLDQYPLKNVFEYFEWGLQTEGRNILVISKIEEFSQQYNSLFNEVYSKARHVEWIIVSNAVNCESIQREFNQTYEPIRFLFLRSLPAVINYINFSKEMAPTSVDLSFFTRIVNFQAFSNDYACILEFRRQEIEQKTKGKRELWLVPESQIKELKNTGMSIYFLELGSVKASEIEVVDSQEDILYVIKEDHEQILKRIGLQELEKRITKGIIRQNLLLQMDPRYCQKVIDRYLQNELVYCLIGFPDKIAKQVKKHLLFVASYPDRIGFMHSSLLCIYFEGTDPHNIFSLEYRKENKVQNEVLRIKSYCEAMKKIGDAYGATEIQKESTICVVYNAKDDRLAKQIQWFTQLSIFQIQDLNKIEHFRPKNIILVGSFTPSEKVYLSSQSREYIDIKECEDSYLVIHSQIIIILKQLTSAPDSLIYLATSPRVISFNVYIEEFKQDPIYINKSINQFRQTLSSIQQNYQHMIIMQMSDYTEERQKKILQIQALKHVTIEVYLLYGNQFIFRRKSQKYHFLKRDQLVCKIQELSVLNKKISFYSKRDLSTVGSWHSFDYDQKIHSDIVNSPFLEASYLSTPNFCDISQRELLILVPKTLPFHSLLNRSSQPYTLLVYSNIEQTHFLVKYLNKHQFAAIIIGNNENNRNIQNLQSLNFQFIKARQLGEKEVRDQIDKIVDRFGMTKKIGSISLHKKSMETLVLHDCSDPKQTKLVSLMYTVFKNSKVISMSKKEFMQINTRHNVTQKFIIYQLGHYEIPSARKIKNVVDLIKVYMSPFSAGCQLTAGDMAFSQRQLFIREYLDRAKKDKIKGKLHELSLSRGLSPRSKSLVGKENVNQAGLVIIQSIHLSKDPKRQKFKQKKEILSLIFGHLKKGNNLVVIITEGQYEKYESVINVKTVGIIWIVVTVSVKKTIIKESSIVYCLCQQVQTIIGHILSRFRTFKNREFEFKQEEDPFREKQTIPVTVYPKWTKFIESLLPREEQLSLVRCVDCKNVTLEELNGALLFGNNSKYQNVLNLFHQNPKISKKEESPLSLETIIVLVQQRNRQFIERSLAILKEESCILVTYFEVSHLVMYSQISKTLIVLEEKDEIRLCGSIVLCPADTPLSFSSKLAGFIQSLRKTT